MSNDEENATRRTASSETDHELLEHESGCRCPSPPGVRGSSKLPTPAAVVNSLPPPVPRSCSRRRRGLHQRALARRSRSGVGMESVPADPREHGRQLPGGTVGTFGSLRVAASSLETLETNKYCVDAGAGPGGGNDILMHTTVSVHQVTSAAVRPRRVGEDLSRLLCLRTAEREFGTTWERRCRNDERRVHEYRCPHPTSPDRSSSNMVARGSSRRRRRLCRQAVGSRSRHFQLCWRDSTGVINRRRRSFVHCPRAARS